MKANRSVAMALMLLIMAACRHHTLTPSIGGRPAQTLQADARKVDDGWVVTLPLPIGNWTPKAVGEEQTMEVVTVDGKAAARWRVRSERWANSERPFMFLLVGSEGRDIQMSVTYTLVPRGAQNILHLLAHGWWPIPLPQ